MKFRADKGTRSRESGRNISRGILSIFYAHAIRYIYIYRINWALANRAPSAKLLTLGEKLFSNGRPDEVARDTCRRDQHPCGGVGALEIQDNGVEQGREAVNSWVNRLFFELNQLNTSILAKFLFCVFCFHYFWNVLIVAVSRDVINLVLNR